jgi:hypothetical protein
MPSRAVMRNGDLRRLRRGCEPLRGHARGRVAGSGLNRCSALVRGWWRIYHIGRAMCFRAPRSNLARGLSVPIGQGWLSCLPIGLGRPACGTLQHVTLTSGLASGARQKVGVPRNQMGLPGDWDPSATHPRSISEIRNPKSEVWSIDRCGLGSEIPFLKNYKISKQWVIC